MSRPPLQRKAWILSQQTSLPIKCSPSHRRRSPLAVPSRSAQTAVVWTFMRLINHPSIRSWAQNRSKRCTTGVKSKTISNFLYTRKAIKSSRRCQKHPILAPSSSTMAMYYLGSVVRVWPIWVADGVIIAIANPKILSMVRLRSSSKTRRAQTTNAWLRETPVFPMLARGSVTRPSLTTTSLCCRIALAISHTTTSRPRRTTLHW